MVVVGKVESSFQVSHWRPGDPAGFLPVGHKLVGSDRRLKTAGLQKNGREMGAAGAPPREMAEVACRS